MANMIDTVEIAGAAVYGVRQVTYTVDGAAGKDYGAALTAAAFKESTAIEDTMTATPSSSASARASLKTSAR